MNIRFNGFRTTSVALAAALLVSACDSAEDRLAEYLANGQQLIDSGEPEKAALEFRNALTIKADSADAHMGMVTIYEEESNFPAMIAHLNKVVEIEPNNKTALVKLGQLMLLAGNFDQANENATAAVAAAPESADALALKAGVSLRLGNADSAVDFAEQALALDPSHANANSVLIGVRLAADDVDGALELANTATERNPDDFGLALVKLRILETKGDDEAVGAYLQETADRFPDQYSLRATLARWLDARGETDRAEAELRAIAEEQPDDAQPKLRVAQYVLETKGQDAARAELNAMSESTENSAPFIVALANLDFRQDRPEDGKARLRSAIEANVEAGDEATANDVRLTLAQRLLREDDMDGALDLAQVVIDNDSANSDALAIRATIAYERKDFNAAILDIRTALASAPSDPRLLLLSARTNLRTGNTDLAGENLAAAMQAAEFAPAITLEYVNFLRTHGRGESAISVMTEAARRHPENVQLLSELANAQLRAQDWVGADQTSERLAAVDDNASRRVRAASLSGQQQYDESLSVLDSISKEEGGESSVLAATVQVHLNAGDRDGARSFLNDVLVENPKNAQALLLRAGIELGDEKVEDAEQTLETAIEAQPEMAAAHLSLARFHGSRGEVEKAIEALRAGVEASDDPTALHLMLGGIYEARQETDKAIAEYRRLYELRPDSSVAANNFASMLAEYGGDDPDLLAEAQEIARPLRSLEVAAFQDTYGWIEHLSGNHEQALRWLTPAADGLPNNPYVRYHVGAAYAALGDAEKARPNLEAAISAGADRFTKMAEAQALLEGLPATE